MVRGEDVKRLWAAADHLWVFVALTLSKLSSLAVAVLFWTGWRRNPPLQTTTWDVMG